MLEQIAQQRGKLDLPLSLEDLRFGTKKIVGNKNLTHLEDKLAACKKKKILDVLKAPPPDESALAKQAQLEAQRYRQRTIQ